MRLSSIIALYPLFWALSFFLVLPFRLRAEGRDVPVQGQADGAPSMFSFARTAKWTTLVAAVIFGLYYANYVYQWVPVQALNMVPDRVLEGR
jgi:predicted secreted protein